jgi:hypothetical protein
MNLAHYVLATHDPLHKVDEQLRRKLPLGVRDLCGSDPEAALGWFVAEARSALGRDLEPGEVEALQYAVENVGGGRFWHEDEDAGDVSPADGEQESPRRRRRGRPSKGAQTVD